MTLRGLDDDVQRLLERWPLALQLDLQPRSNVVVVGAYKGLTIDLLDHLYPECRYIGYEPQRFAYDLAVARLADRIDRIVLQPYALGAMAGERILWESDTDAASFYRTNQRLSSTVGVRSVSNEIEEIDSFGPVDLLLMNCEGAEFELLPIMIEERFIRRCSQLVLQFHFGLGNDESYFDICRSLLSTHQCLRADKDWHHWRRR